MKKLELRQMIQEEIQKLKEGHSSWIGPMDGVSNQQKAVKKAQEEIDNDEKYGGDLERFRGVKFVGNTSEDRLERLSDKYEDDYTVVGIVDGEFWSASTFRT